MGQKNGTQAGASSSSQSPSTVSTPPTITREMYSVEGEENAILHAVCRGELRHVQHYLDTDDFDLNLRNDAGDTALHCCVKLGEHQTAELLLRRGACVDSCDPSGYTPLMQSVIHPDLPFIHLLLRYGANVDAAGNDGLTPLHCAIRLRQRNCIKALLPRRPYLATVNAKTGETPMHAATTIVDSSLLESMLRARYLTAAIPDVLLWEETVRDRQRDHNDAVFARNREKRNDSKKKKKKKSKNKNKRGCDCSECSNCCSSSSEEDSEGDTTSSGTGSAFTRTDSSGSSKAPSVNGNAKEERRKKGSSKDPNKRQRPHMMMIGSSRRKRRTGSPQNDTVVVSGGNNIAAVISASGESWMHPTGRSLTTTVFSSSVMATYKMMGPRPPGTLSFFRSLFSTTRSYPSWSNTRIGANSLRGPSPLSDDSEDADSDDGAVSDSDDDENDVHDERDTHNGDEDEGEDGCNNAHRVMNLQCFVTPLSPSRAADSNGNASKPKRRHRRRRHPFAFRRVAQKFEGPVGTGFPAAGAGSSSTLSNSSGPNIIGVAERHYLLAYPIDASGEMTLLWVQANAVQLIPAPLRRLMWRTWTAESDASHCCKKNKTANGVATAPPQSPVGKERRLSSSSSQQQQQQKQKHRDVNHFHCNRLSPAELQRLSAARANPIDAVDDAGATALSAAMRAFSAGDVKHMNSVQMLVFTRAHIMLQDVML